MNIFSFVKEFLKGRSVARYRRADVLKLREKRLRETLLHAYDFSHFYRALWSSAGIKREDIFSIPLARLPIVTKRQLMESFSSVVTRPDITKQDVERFIASDPSGKKLYRGQYVALNTSGSSGYVGIFLFDQKFWSSMVGAIAARLILPPFRGRRSRIAFLGETHGHHAGVTLAESGPAWLFKTLPLSISAAREVSSASLNAFKPDLLVGYAGALTRAAQEQLAGRLKIAPQLIISSGEPLSPLRQETLARAFGARVADLYGATECLGIGLDPDGSGALQIFDDLVFLEVVDDQQNPLPPGVPGRVVITVFGNRIQPLVRYSLDDTMVLEQETGPAGHPFTRASRVSGRVLERLVFSFQGRKIEIPSMELVGLFFPGLRQYQIIQTGPRQVAVRLVVKDKTVEAQQRIEPLVAAFMKELNLPENFIEVKLEFVEAILPDPKTGKTPIIVPANPPL